MTVLVFLSDDDRLAFKPDVKGARWRGGFKSIVEVSNALDADGVPVPRDFDFVATKEG